MPRRSNSVGRGTEVWRCSLVWGMPTRVTLAVKNLPGRAGDAGDMGWEDPLEEEMATHSSILAWRIPWTKEPGGLQSMGLQRVGHD